MELNEKIRKYRLDNNLSQEELAAKIYVSRTLITKYESGSAFPTPENLHKLAEVFGVKDEDLLSDEEKNKIVEESYQRKNRSLFVSAIIYGFLSLLLLVFLFIPWHQASHYDYSHVTHENRTPRHYFTYESLFTGSINSHYLFVPILTIFIALGGIITAILSLVSQNGKKKKIFLIVSLSLLIATLIMFVLSFVIMFGQMSSA